MRTFRLSRLVTILTLTLVGAGGLDAVSSCRPQAAACDGHFYWAKGRVISIDAKGPTLVVAHEAIVGWKGPGEATFVAQSPQQVARVQKGDGVLFEFEMRADGVRIISRIDRIAL
jgi:hypothetical protein